MLHIQCDGVLLLNIEHNKIFYTATSYLNELIFNPIAFLINAKSIPKYSFRGFRGVNVSKSWEVKLNHCGCSPRGFTIFMDHFMIFNSNPVLVINIDFMLFTLMTIIIINRHNRVKILPFNFLLELEWYFTCKNIGASLNGECNYLDTLKTALIRNQQKNIVFRMVYMSAENVPKQ